MDLRPIAHIRTDFPDKFGIPRQSDCVPELYAEIVFDPPYNDPDYIRGIEEFSHLWLIWEFSENVGKKATPTVRPPRLGGNTRVGVFASRSPFRPNPVGLSCVRLEKIRPDEKLGNVLVVRGADMVDGTPIYDIKPYIPHADMIRDAVGGFADERDGKLLSVVIPDGIASLFDEDRLNAIRGILSDDPRPSYHDDPDRVYRFTFAGYEISFSVKDGVLTVISAEREE